MSTRSILTAVRQQDWHTANEAFASTMGAKLAQALAVERKQVFKEAADDESALTDGAKCSNCGYVKHEKTFQRDRCNHCNKSNIWVANKTVKEAIEWMPTHEVQRVFDEIGDVSETALLCGVRQLKINSARQVVSYVAEGVGQDRGGWKTVKMIPSHVGVTRFYDECEREGAFVGWVKRQPQIRTPYSSGPTHGVMRWNGKNVILAETSHKRYEVIEVPAREHIYKTDDEATSAYIADLKAKRQE